MSGRARLWVFAAGAAVVAALFTMACLALPPFGGDHHPYGDRAVRAALARLTPNSVASVNFDQRAFDTLGEETILFSAVLGTVVLLRQTRGDRRHGPAALDVSARIRWYGALMLPVALLIGFYVVAHGPITPGGGFQGGVVVATGLHLLYVAADYRALERIRPIDLYEIGDALGEAAFVITGVRRAGPARQGRCGGRCCCDGRSRRSGLIQQAEDVLLTTAPDDLVDRLHELLPGVGTLRHLVQVRQHVGRQAHLLRGAGVDLPDRRPLAVLEDLVQDLPHLGEGRTFGHVDRLLD
ncbi:MnhB domain-containing protein [Nonomuraea phyllanthi]|uniref:MnhB domain-containing protein n=1 Tax=Nonomuraea phyllanthi TaxID=2219224 RepID=UPI00186B2A0C|nr:MnhB domain-containing protein [Nonomuraea phyllanthi]